ncbi:electron transfer flavoprotein subunit alpha/FixB family protein [Sulfobacillus harzensis]|uniref:Electron transfer flavoprotein subunit alpha/FixB family protein n=1 Tax=Sulfobacillus harzensis TaxID=2729629 RepID=A0A7Y0L6C3_9FIRM|nr:electron transfer flavoprotein subunit alpha/FixB family protein [Sulfobacillus harzensis]NMP23848.1 electron transfer flavoprotein subunit alpha/FixB family protein [Sulfobacillus harzensis]
MASGILVVFNQEGGRVRRVAYEMLSLAQKLAPGSITALTFGEGADQVREAVGRYGADRVILLSSPTYHRYSSDGFAQAVAQAVEAVDPEALFFPANAWGKDLAPRVAGLLGAGLASDCTEVHRREDGRLGAIRPIYAGKAYARVAIDSPRQIFSLRPNIQAVEESGRAADVLTVDPGLDASSFQAVVSEVIQSQGGQMELTEADIIVSGGRGIKAPENFKVLEDLAEAVGAALGSSRPVADEGWVPHSYHIGQTGKVVSPTVYFAVGISGAIQHLAGISGSKYIVAINNDPDAPIFKAANYGIVGDLFKVVPALANEVRRIKQDA